MHMYCILHTDIIVPPAKVIYVRSIVSVFNYHMHDNSRGAFLYLFIKCMSRYFFVFGCFPRKSVGNRNISGTRYTRFP